MYTANSHDLFYFILAIVTAGIGIFLCWALVEVARLLHQANNIVEAARERLAHVDEAFQNLKNRVDASVKIFSILAEGGKTLMSHVLKEKQEERKGRRSRRAMSESDDE